MEWFLVVNLYPAKALVILDTAHDLPAAMTRLPSEYGVVVRSTPRQLQADIALKLRVANGTHTAAAHAMALCKLLKTDVLSSSASGELFMAYLDSLFACDILRGAATTVRQGGNGGCLSRLEKAIVSSALWIVHLFHYPKWCCQGRYSARTDSRFSTTGKQRVFPLPWRLPLLPF